MQYIIGYLSGVVLFIGLVFYLVAIYKGKASSNRVTWGVWILVNALFCASYYASVGLVASIWVPLVYLVGTLLIFIFLLRYGKPGYWEWSDKAALIGVFIILIFWFIFRSPLATLTFTLLIDIIGAIPLIHTVWKDPKTDYGPAWYLGFIANALNLFAVEKWDYANAIYPVYLTILTLTVSLLIAFPKVFHKK